MKQRIDLNGNMLDFHGPGDMETIWEQMEDLSWEESMPYWVEVWPSGTVLAEWILKKSKRIANRNCLDLGCGLGVTTCAGALGGAALTALDNELEALRYTKYNLQINNLPRVNLLNMDWEYPALKSRSFEFIFGADVLYESRFFLPLLRLFRYLLAPGGRIWLAAPDRAVTKPFWELLKKTDWETTLLLKKSSKQSRNNKPLIYLWELKKD